MARISKMKLLEIDSKIQNFYGRQLWNKSVD
jgi:hypothetical protein